MRCAVRVSLLVLAVAAAACGAVAHVDHSAALARCGALPAPPHATQPPSPACVPGDIMICLPNATEDPREQLLRFRASYMERPTAAAVAARENEPAPALTLADSTCVVETDLAWLDWMHEHGALDRLRDGTCEHESSAECQVARSAARTILWDRKNSPAALGARIDRWIAANVRDAGATRCPGNARARALEAALREDAPESPHHLEVPADLVSCLDVVTLDGPFEFVEPRGENCGASVSVDRACPANAYRVVVSCVVFLGGGYRSYCVRPTATGSWVAELVSYGYG